MVLMDVTYVIIRICVLYLSLSWLQRGQSIILEKQAQASIEVDQPLLKHAVFSILIQTSDHFKDSNFFSNAASVICSARKYGSNLPFHLSYAGLDEKQVTFLKALGWNTSNSTDEVEFWKTTYKPVYNKSQASKEHRRFVDGQKVYHRVDGWATYFKFNAWKATDYDRIMITDLDVEFVGNPDPSLNDLPTNITFFSKREGLHRLGYMGLNTHLMIVKPSWRTFKELLRKAQSGNYTPYTNTEQDILEDYFPWHELPDVPHVHHENPNANKSNKVRCNSEHLLRLIPVPSCKDFYNICH